MISTFHIQPPPRWCLLPAPEKHLLRLRHPLPHAKVRVWSDGLSFLFEQYYVSINISVYSYEMHTNSADEACINIYRGHLHGLCLLESTEQMIFRAAEDTLQIQLEVNEACYTYVPSGSYSASIGPGVHVLWGFVLHQPLVDYFNQKSYQHLYDLVYEQQGVPHTQLQITPYFKIDIRIRKHLLYLIHSISADPLLTKERLAKGVRLLIELSKELLFEQYQQIRSDQTLALKAKKHIEHLVDTKGFDFQIKDVALHLEVSHAHLSRVYTHINQHSLQSYFDQILIDKIKEYLLQVRSVSDTAFEFNFFHSNNLSRYFRKHTGLTPTQFIKQNKET